MSMHEIVVSFFLLVGVFFILTGTIGLLRLPDFYNRIHAPTKATTLGVSSIILGAIIYFYGLLPDAGFKEILAIVFIFLTTPVGAHMLAKAAYHSKIELWKGTIVDERAGKRVIGEEKLPRDEVLEKVEEKRSPEQS
jgi:monovalent cation/proton antiporter MnhG/PhaG subunit